MLRDVERIVDHGINGGLISAVDKFVTTQVAALL